MPQLEVLLLREQLPVGLELEELGVSQLFLEGRLRSVVTTRVPEVCKSRCCYSALLSLLGITSRPFLSIEIYVSGELCF